MSCGCSDRLRKLLLNLGWKLGNEMWYSPDGEEIHDSELETHHSVIAIRALWSAGKNKIRKPLPNGRVYYVTEENHGNTN